jgi:hypothetical protein
VGRRERRGREEGGVREVMKRMGMESEEGGEEG